MMSWGRTSHLCCQCRSMAEMLGGKALQCYDEVFSHESKETRHLHQEATPRLAAPIVPKIYVQ